MKKIFCIAIIMMASISLFSTMVSAETYFLHLAGTCSTSWGDEMGDWVDGVSVDCAVDLTESISHAANEFANEYLDTYCTGDNWCYIFNYSAGDAVTGYALANAQNDYNIIYVATAAGAGGGSELANSEFFATAFGCDTNADLDPTTIRNMYNHNDTAGTSVYRIAGYSGWWYSGSIVSGEDDGAVGYHSAGGCTVQDSYDSLCDCTQWNNHYIAYTCGGYDKDHYEMKTYFIELLGGYSSGSSDITIPEEADDFGTGGDNGCG